MPQLVADDDDSGRDAFASIENSLAQLGVPEADLAACAEGSLGDGAIVYNGKFAAEHDLVLGVYRNAF